MVFEVLVALPFAAGGILAYQQIKKLIKYSKEADDPNKEFFSVGYFTGEAFKAITHNGKRTKVPGSDFVYRVVLLANGNDERKYEIRSGNNGNVGEIARQARWFISYVDPWLQKTIDTRKLIEIATDDGFQVVAVNYKKIEENK